MQRGQVDVVHRRRRPHRRARGDVCNKIGTYLKALAAHDNGVPFYVAVPLVDASTGRSRDGLAEIPIEERDARRGHARRGPHADGRLVEVRSRPRARRPRTRPSTSRRRGW